MYKSKLQELCQRYWVALPEYTSVKVGPDHDARFTATVTVNGISFQSPPNQCRSAKDAQNLASRFAFEYFTANPHLLHSTHPQHSATRPPDLVVAPVLQSLSPPLQPSPAPIHLVADSSLLPPQFAQIPNSAWLAGPQPVRPPLLQQTPPSLPPKSLSEASTPNTNVGQSKESTAQASVVTPLYSTEPANLKGMFKSKLQELCHKQSWNQPEYRTVKEGPDHNPQFGATVIVNGIPFKTPDNHCRSSKEATNLAACIALEHFTGSKLTVPQQSQFPPIASSSSGHTKNEIAGRNNETNSQTPEFGSTPLVHKEICKSSGHTKNEIAGRNNETNSQTPEFGSTPLVRKEICKSSGHTKNEIAGRNNETNSQTPEFGSTPLVHKEICKSSGHTKNEIAGRNNETNSQTPEFGSTPLVRKEICKSSDIQHMYKNQLQQYAQKQNIILPKYSCEVEGPPHACRFRSKVAFGGKIFESHEFFSTLKEAEQAAAKIALEALSPQEIQKGAGLYKTLLQQLEQKQGGMFPVYKTIQSGPPHAPTFVATVVVGGETYQGQEAKSKKEAEMSAAEVAYNSCLKGTDNASKRQKMSAAPGTHVHAQSSASPSNISSAPKSHSLTPLQHTTDPAVESVIQSSSEFYAKEMDKIEVSQPNSNEAVSGV
ncbi:double-stranded RNA-binding protein 1-like isoform X2 [Ipomoea triloba]|uniref:double-stranded RNA-binding protein 1-like isoform X2 n=1 Tax=Ipomoea triloba TaxID=35885 RepID=UPI00125E60F7|nr:double-stranded RNA-binding protein 1-like isoform X2 [Ipomoea triloba]